MAKISLYGKVAIRKDFCKDCGGEYFILDGKYACCGERADSSTIRSVKRECESLTKSLKIELKQRILIAQRFKCFICGCSLNEILYYIKRNKPRRLYVHFDHFIPRSFTCINEFDNIYAMCSLCNATKGSKMFDTFEDARTYVMNQRTENGTIELYTSFELSAISLGQSSKE